MGVVLASMLLSNRSPVYSPAVVVDHLPSFRSPLRKRSRQKLRQLHAYRDQCLCDQPIGAAALASLRRTPLVHVRLLGGAWWDALEALPDTVASVHIITRDCRLALRLGCDDEGQVGGEQGARAGTGTGQGFACLVVQVGLVRWI